MIIYKITNKNNNKIYIGCSTKTVEERFYRHWVRRFDKTAFARALLKYGKDSFVCEKIEDCLTNDEMYKREIYWIKVYESNNPKIGYNLTDGGDTGPVRFGKEHWNFGGKNDIISQRNKKLKGLSYEEIYGIEKAKEIKSKISLAKNGRKHSDISKANMSIKRKEAWDAGKYKDAGNVISKAKKGVRSNKRIKIKCLNNDTIYDGYTEAAKQLGLSGGNITNVVNGKYKHTKQYSFIKI